MRHLALSIILFCGNFSFLFAQSTSAKDEPASNLLHEIYKRVQPEFIQLHADKEIYFSGENLWYKVYLVNAPYSAMDLSVVAYVELVDTNKEILVRQKLKCTNGLASGRIALPKELPEGMYHIRAFTHWMNNIGDSTFYHKRILILNASTGEDEFSLEQKATQKQTGQSYLRIRLEGENLFLSRPDGVLGQLIIQSRGKVLYQQEVEKLPSEEKISLGDASTGFITVALLDNNRELLDEQVILYESQWPRVEMIANKVNYFPRDKMEVQVRLEDRDGKPLSGNFSVSVREIDPVVIVQDTPFEGTLPWRDIVHLSYPVRYSKEKIVYPKPTFSLDPIGFPSKIPNGTKVLSAGSNTQAIRLMKERHRLESSVAASYQLESLAVESTVQSPPSDNTYYPKDFLALPTLREFIKEIIPQARVKTKHGQDILRLRNTENSNHVYFYSQNPLLLVDGVIVSDLSSVLALDPSAIHRIDLSWKLNTINAAGVNALANHGILAISTKQGGRSEKQDNQLYEGFVPVDIFPSVLHNKKVEHEDKFPDLRNPIYWNHGINLVNGNARFSYYLPDGFGDIVIQVKGVTTEGLFFSGEKKIAVNFRNESR